MNTSIEEMRRHNEKENIPTVKVALIMLAQERFGQIHRGS